MSHIRIFEHPADKRLLGSGGIPALGITGTLASAKPSIAYEGLLSITNWRSDATVIYVTPGILPPGATVSVDNTAKKVVVAWPAYQSAALAIPNAGASEADLRGWDAGAGWKKSTVADFARFEYSGASGASILSSTFRAAVTSGQSVTASVQVNQGASSKGNAGAAVRLEYRDASGNLLSSPEGNVVDAASNSAIYPSTVTALAPAAGTVNVAARGFRKRQNKALWVDTFAWNVTVPVVGINTEGTIGPFTIRIRDAMGREAEWTGSITVVDIVILPVYQIGTVGGADAVSKSLDGVAFGTAFTPGGVGLSGPYFVFTSTNRAIMHLPGSVATKYSDDYLVTLSTGTVLSEISANSPQGFAAGAGVVLISLNTGGFARSVNDGGTYTKVGTGKASGRLSITDTGKVLSISASTEPLFSGDAGATWGALGSRLDTTPEAFNPLYMVNDNSTKFFIAGSMWGGPLGLSDFIPAVCVMTDAVTANAAFYPIGPVAAGNAFGIGRGVLDGVDTLIALFANGDIYRSTNAGVSWTKCASTMGASLASFAGVDFNGSTFIVSATSSSNTPIIKYSTDADIFTSSTHPFTGTLGNMRRQN